MSRLTRLASGAALAGLAVVLVAAPAWAHPLGNVPLASALVVSAVGVRLSAQAFETLR